MNKLWDKIIEERQGHYCHDIEVENVLDIESIVEGVIDAYYEENIITEKDIIDFFETITVHYLGEDSVIEQEIYSFNFKDCIKGTIE